MIYLIITNMVGHILRCEINLLRGLKLAWENLAPGLSLHHWSFLQSVSAAPAAPYVLSSVHISVGGRHPFFSLDWGRLETYGTKEVDTQSRYTTVEQCYDIVGPFTQQKTIDTIWNPHGQWKWPWLHYAILSRSLDRQNYCFPHAFDALTHQKTLIRSDLKDNQFYPRSNPKTSPIFTS